MALAVEGGSPVPTLQQLRTHLNFNDPAETGNDDEILDALAAAVEVVENDPEFPLVAAAMIDGDDHPALRWALMEFVRDMWTGTQTGGAFGSAVPDDDLSVPVLTSGRPVLPPYVRGLLGPYRSATSGAPVGSFPDAPEWVAW